MKTIVKRTTIVNSTVISEIAVDTTLGRLAKRKGVKIIDGKVTIVTDSRPPVTTIYSRYKVKS